jgi:hypothetical protein
MAAMVAVWTNPIDSFNAMVQMFKYGALDIPYLGTPTGASIARQNNRNILNNSMRGTALSYAYLSASELTFDTVKNIQTVQDLLESQYQDMLHSEGMDKNLLDAITDQRSDVAELFGQQKLTARQQVTTRTNLTTARLLAFKHYGSDEDGATLARLNEQDTLVMIGEVEILTP